MKHNLIWFQFPGLDNIYCVFQGRTPGADSLAGNISFRQGQDVVLVESERNKLKEYLFKNGLKEWRECHQVHGDRIIINPGEEEEADGMMGSALNCGFLIKTADCQPILFASRSGKHIMAIHAGWRGNRINFPGKAVKAFCSEYNISPEDIFAVRGPSLGPAKSEFINFDSEWGNDFEKWFDRKNSLMNLWELTKSQLKEAGVPEKQIYGIDICTASNDHLFFSYRKDHKCGRQASIIWKKA